MGQTLQSLQQSLQEKADAKQLEDFERAWTQQKFYQGKASFNQIQVIQRSLDEMAKKIELVLNQKVDQDDVDLVTDALKANVDRINNEVAVVKTQALDIEVLDRKVQ